MALIYRRKKKILRCAQVLLPFYQKKGKSPDGGESRKGYVRNGESIKITTFVGMTD